MCRTPRSSQQLASIQKSGKMLAHVAPVVHSNGITSKVQVQDTSENEYERTPSGVYAPIVKPRKSWLRLLILHAFLSWRWSKSSGVAGGSLANSSLMSACVSHIELWRSVDRVGINAICTSIKSRRRANIGMMRENIDDLIRAM